MEFKTVTKRFIVLIFCLLLLPVSASRAESDLVFSCQVPYYLGKARESVAPGERVQVLFSIENRSSETKEADIVITLPAGFLPAEGYENWQVRREGAQYSLYRHIALTGGYSQWFDLFPLQAALDLQPGTYTFQITDGNKVQEAVVQVGAQDLFKAGGTIMLDQVVLPLDKDGKKDDRLNRNTLVLRDRRWDYYKNVLKGKGASNQEIEAIHPLAYLGIDIRNPARQQNLAVVSVQLLDANTREAVPGLFTPGTTGEDQNAGALAGHEGSLVALAALNGEEWQRIQVPVYTDEQLISGSGQYLLQVELAGEGAAPLQKEVPVTIIKQDDKAAAVVSVATAVLLVAILAAVKRIPSVLMRLKTRWLVTIALFGAAAFAVVNVPATLLNDVFHILLGPFSFLITGLFHSIFLYMMIITLVILIPQPGVVALLTMIRMLLGMLAFGQVLPVIFLFYGTQAFLLEAVLAGTGMYRAIKQADSGRLGMPTGLIIKLALLSGAADSIATYVNLQGMAFLYRLYYADWYIWLILAVNGFLYTLIGAACGTLLGNRLLRVGGD